MNVADIIEKVAQLSLGDADPSVEEQESILDSLNAVYAILISKISDMDSQIGKYSQTNDYTTDANGDVTLPNAHALVRRAWSKDDERELEAVNLADIEEIDPFGKDTDASPLRFYLSGEDKVRMHPVPTAGHNIRLRYMEAPNILQLTTVEAAIKIPPSFHILLVWQTLPFVAIDERDKGSTSLLSYYETKARDLEDELFDYLNRQPNSTLYTEAY